MATGFLLHSRPYRETSSLLSFFSDTAGRLDTVARSTRTTGKRRQPTPLLFAPYDLQSSGKGELRYLQHCEPAGLAFALQGQSLYCGLYINELLYRLLSKQEAEPVLFQAYLSALQQLASGGSPEPCLRVFELALLDAIGYGLSLQHDLDGMPLDPARKYAYLPERGLMMVEKAGSDAIVSGHGQLFIAIAANDYAEPDVRQVAKQLLRRTLALYLGNKPLQSRKLFAP